MIPEGEKHWAGVPVVIGGDNLPSPVGIGLADLPNIGVGPPGPPGSGITATSFFLSNCLENLVKRKGKFQNEAFDHHENSTN